MGDIFLKLLNMSIIAGWMILAVIGSLQTTDTQKVRKKPVCRCI